MNADPFEKQLRHRHLRPVPKEWRAEILSAAQEMAPTEELTMPHARSTPRWSEWWWPHPVAWAGLAACWGAILLLHFAASPGAAELAEARRNARVATAYSAVGRPLDGVGLVEPGAQRSPDYLPHGRVQSPRASVPITLSFT